MKIAIVGTRAFTNYKAASKVLDGFVQDEDIIVSGGARGADSLAERYAEERYLDTIIFKPEWNKYGGSAGMIRNGQIVEECDYVIAFWDNKSKGTADTIRKAENTGKTVIKIDVSNIIEADQKLLEEKMNGSK